MDIDISLLKNRHFTKLWVGQGVSLFGSLVSRLALPFVVIYVLNASATQIAWLRVCESVPGIAVGLFAGVWVDWLRRRQLMIVSDIARAVLVGWIVLVLFLGHLGWIPILLTSAVLSIFTVTFDSAYGAYIPTLVKPDEITDANAKLSATGALAEVVGFSLSGALFEWLGGALTLSLDALSFLFSAFALLSIRKPEVHTVTSQQREPLRQALVKGLTYLWSNKKLTVLTGISGVQNFFYGMSGTVYMLYISRGLDVAPGVQGVLYAVGGVASFAISLIAGRLFQKLGLGKVLILVSVVGTAGAAFLPVAFGPMWLVILFILAQQVVGDSADTVLEIGVTAFCQTQTDNGFLGRVNSIWQVITSLCMLAGTLMAGEMAGRVGLRDTLFVAVAVRFLAIALVALSPLRNARGMDESTPS